MSAPAGPFKVLMICMGNICRSPTAEAVLREQLQRAGLADQVQVDSAGTHAYHVGEPPDARATAHAQRRGLDLSTQRARQLTPADFDDFDLLLAMDWDNLALIEASCPPAARHKVQLLMSWAPGAASPVVPDPYYGGDAGFEEVLDLCEQASAALVAQLPQRLAQRAGQQRARQQAR